MKKTIVLLAVLAVLAVGISANFAADALTNTTDFNAAVKDAQAQNKNIVIIFDQDNCVYCDMLKNDVLSDSKVIGELNTNSILVFVNINDNPQLAAKYKVYGTPTTVILDSGQHEIGKIEGYVDADEFLKTLQGV